MTSDEESLGKIPENRVTREDALRTARTMIERLHLTVEEVLINPAIPAYYRKDIRSELEKERNLTLEPVHVIAEGDAGDWFRKTDRSSWYYWPQLRAYYLKNGWDLGRLRALDNTTDRILMRFPPPESPVSDVRGLVLGYVQSGKTSNFTATIAKAADCGYRLFIVLSGIDKGLRRQTQIRLERELMGYGVTDGDSNHVPFPPQLRQWHKFTTNDLEGDFFPGNANQASLQGPEPVIMVIKKNGAVIRRLLRWLESAPQDVLRTIPTLIIDDEADLASIDTRGSYQTEDDEPSTETYEPPSVINSLIRGILNHFQKKVYVAYTATPFANILIPHDIYDPEAGNDLYPKDFIIDLPKPDGYFGAEELFGMNSPDDDISMPGLGTIRTVTEEDAEMLEMGQISPEMEKSMLCFVLAASARAQREGIDKPTTMLIHTSQRIESHMNVASAVQRKFNEFKDRWRYYRSDIEPVLKTLWDDEFRPLIQDRFPQRDIPFESLASPDSNYIGRIFESVQVRTVNSFTGSVLDYDREPALKAIGVGGNKLSRGLTLEGLSISFFVRDSPTYDTLMQMGRWFGFRKGYEDLIRIWTTPELADRFAHLALVEHRLRQDIMIYEDMQLNPMELGMRILEHPAMQITSYLKRRYARRMLISQSYSEQLEQTFKFPFDRPLDLAAQQDANASLVNSFLASLGNPKWEDNRPVWMDVPGRDVLGFLTQFQQDDSPETSGCSLPLIRRYIENQIQVNELNRWTVAVMGRETGNETLGVTVWQVEGRHISQISRTRLKNTLSLGVITSPEDERIGLSEELVKRAENLRENLPHIGRNHSYRRVRSPENGVLLIYPISRNSEPEGRARLNRERLFSPSDSNARDLIAIAISFPASPQPHPVQAYLTGTVGWRTYDEQP